MTYGVPSRNEGASDLNNVLTTFLKIVDFYNTLGRFKVDAEIPAR